MKKNNMMKRFLGAVMAFVVSCTLMMQNAASMTNAAAEDVMLCEASATATPTADEAIQWCKSQVGKSLDYDGNGVWCVDLVFYYYKALGVSPVMGNGIDFSTNNLPANWTRTKNGVPKKGDILIYSGSGGYGHVAISADDGGNTSYHQNWSGKYVEYVKTNYNTTNTIKYYGCIHPNFADERTFDPAVINTTASLKNLGSNEYLTVEGGQDTQKAAVITGAKSAAMNFTVSQVNGFADSHKIKPVRFSRIVNPLADVVKAGVKVTLYDDQGSKNDSSQWFVFEKVGESSYVIHNKQNPSCVLSVNNHQVVMAAYNSGDQNQIWLLEAPIEKHSDTQQKNTDALSGCDISKNQGNANFDLLSNKVDFVIMRSNTGSFSDLSACYEDSKFKTYIKAASKTDLALGVYGWCPAATKTDMVNYTNTMLKTIAGYDYKMGVWLDIEAVDAQYALGKTQLTQIILAGLDNIAAAGYFAGVYASANDWKHYIDADLLREQGYLTWVAAWPGCDDPTSKYDYSAYDIWQYSNKGSLSGISGNVDLDICYRPIASEKKNSTPDELSYIANSTEFKDGAVVYIYNAYDGSYLCCDEIKKTGNIRTKSGMPDSDRCKFILEEDPALGGYIIRSYADPNLIVNPYCDLGKFTGNSVNVLLYPDCQDANQRWMFYSIPEDDGVIRYSITNVYEDGGLECSETNAVLNNTGDNIWVFVSAEEATITKIIDDIVSSAIEAAITAASLIGDLNCDENVTVSDAILLARILAEDSNVQISETGLVNAEFIDDNTGITAEDLSLLMKVLASSNV